MSLPLLQPHQCLTMADVRNGVDALDARLIELLSQRFAYMRAAARLKEHRSAVRDEGRKAQVIANATELAGVMDVPVNLVEEIWERLVEGSISYELEHWDSQRG